MPNIQIIDYTHLKPGECKARLFLCDALTGEPLDRLRLPDFRNNSATPLAPEVGSRLIGGFVDPGTGSQGPTTYSATRIEWGSGEGMQGLPFATIPDLETSFSPRVFTDIVNPREYPAKGIVRFLSYIQYPTVPLNTPIQEVGLRTNNLSNYPDGGILIARFQNETPIAISNNRIKIGVEWIWVYG